jgi:hypothetical protein
LGTGIEKEKDEEEEVEEEDVNGEEAFSRDTSVYPVL